MDAISRLDLRTVTWQCAIHAHKAKLRALKARSIRIETQHLAGVLLTLEKCDCVLARWNARESIFQCVTDVVAVDRQPSVGIFSTCEGSSYFYNHNGLRVNS